MPKPAKTRKKSRISKIAACIRKTAATVRLKKTSMPDSPAFDPSKLTPYMSSKFTTVIAKIRELDATDMTKYGTKFKHFVFTDLRESAYGAKAFASYLIGAGFVLRMANVHKQIRRGGRLVETKYGETQFVPGEPVTGGSDSFAMLQSLPLWKNPLATQVKRTILKTYNSRPDNVHGELLRIIVLDSKFKEGIDLRDVKYVHLLEPAIATSDLKQAVGRATRFCGQEGLAFQPNRGWPLDVFVYRTHLPGRPPFGNSSSDTIDAHALMMAKSGLDLALLSLTKELTILAIKTAVDYDLTFKVNNFKIESAILEEMDDDALIEVATDSPGSHASAFPLNSPQTQKGGVRTAPATPVAVHDIADLTPAMLARCFKRSNKLFPVKKSVMKAVADRLGYKLHSKAKREDFCRLMKEKPDYFRAVLDAAPEFELPTASSMTASPSISGSVGTDYFAAPATSPRSTISDFSIRSTIRSLKSMKSPTEDPHLKFKTAKFRDAVEALSKRPFAEFQRGIAELYDAFKWDSPVVKSGCGVIAAAPAGQPVSFTRTQDFVRHYLNPESPFKGLLAWHSVGTGKTCMAVAAATSEFEQADYTILWVTRNALMSDVYKNIFGAVCSIPIMESIQDGAVVPSDLGKAKRMLSRAWIKPITYRMFQNALQGKNELGRMLKAKNPRDPLHKTFLIMDEVHKLMDGDLSAAEAADFDVIQKFIHESYAKSGAESVRPLLMTATPITDTPKELFEILNTLIASPSQRLIPFNTFRERYTSAEGEISAAGVDYFQEKAKGLISYLNREYDPSTFAQPIFHDVSIPIGAPPAPSAAELARNCVAGVELPAIPTSCPEVDAAEAAVAEARKEAEGMPKKAAAAALKRIDKTLKAARKICDKRAVTAKKARASAGKAALKCFTTQSRVYKKSLKGSQLKEMEKCFGGKAEKTSDYPSKSAFQTEVSKLLSA